ncbi:MAG: type II toxin-antitoxin system prevent-host-death family antitoxin [Propionibacteriaceae bacterium]|nr:type II toxin-antitoxin system prevent-host-death family antitoxin [Propionibacteriaceae bacterium]
MTLVLEHTEMTATEVSRHFSDVLDRARAGETITVVRNGQAVAQVTPPPSQTSNGAAVMKFLRNWEGDAGGFAPEAEGFTPEFADWLDSLGEPNQRDEERASWVDGLR